MTDHPITPPAEILSRWEEDWHHAKVKHIDLEDHIATQASRWGADQELEACCEWGNDYRNGLGRELRAARRPKPLSLKEQALKALNSASFQPGTDFRQIDPARSATIRRALEQLDD